MKHLILGALLFAGLQTYAQKPLALRITQEGNPIYCGITEVLITVDKKKIILESAKGSLILTVIKKKDQSAKAEDTRGNIYYVDAYYDGDKGYKLVLTPEINYLFKYEVANINICEK
jgi:allophanate hydrolase subunit 1